MYQTTRPGPTILAAMLLALAGCGGGGDSDNAGTAGPTPSSPKAEGVYAGTTSTGYELSLLVLENDVAWGMYTWNYQGSDYLVGFVQGPGVSKNGSFSIADGRDYHFLNDITYKVTASGTYVPGVSIQGSVTDGSTSLSFTATTAAVIGYDYRQPATLSAVAGTWSGFYSAGWETGTVSVSATGAVSGATSSGCIYGGTVAPRASGKNVYDVSITFGPSPCALPGQSATGIAVITSGGKQLLVAATTASRAYGATFVGQR